MVSKARKWGDKLFLFALCEIPQRLNMFAQLRTRQEGFDSYTFDI